MVTGGHGVGHINKVTLRRTPLVPEVATIFGGSTLPDFIHTTQANSAWPSLRG